MPDEEISMAPQRRHLTWVLKGGWQMNMPSGRDGWGNGVKLLTYWRKRPAGKRQQEHTECQMLGGVEEGREGNDEVFRKGGGNSGSKQHALFYQRAWGQPCIYLYLKPYSSESTILWISWRFSSQSRHFTVGFDKLSKIREQRSSWFKTITELLWNEWI